MSVWSGDFVSDALGIHLDGVDPAQVHALMGMALRKNPRRAHLLVSNVLGKHVPQSPAIIDQAALALATQVATHMADPTVDGGALREATTAALVARMGHTGPDLAMAPVPRDVPITVFGYAETATNLGALVAWHLGADFIHSTRYPVVEGDYGSFEEEHSHATSHHITPRDVSILDDPGRTLVLVDDELTTGNTIMNTIRLFESHAHHGHYFVATLTDLRTGEALEAFSRFGEELGITVTVVSLLSFELEVRPDAVEVAEPIIADLKAVAEHTPRRNRPRGGGSQPLASLESIPLGSRGMGPEDFSSLRTVAENWANLLGPQTGDVLVLGVEEDMHLAFLLALALEDISPQARVSFSSTTRSPVVTRDDPDYAIRDRIRFVEPQHGEDGVRYAYNIGWDRDSTILVTHDPHWPAVGLMDALVPRLHTFHWCILMTLNREN